MKDSSEPSPARQATAREFLTVVFRRKRLIVGLFLTTTVTIAIIALTRPVLYQSTGRVMVKRGERESLLEGGKRFLQWEEELASEVQVIQSLAVVERAQTLLDQAAGGRSPVRIETARVSAEVVGESNVILIAYQDRDPAVAQQAADALVRGYIDYRNQTYTLPYPSEFFRTELKKVSGQLARASEERREFAAAQNVVDPNQQGSSLLSLRMNLRQKLTEVESELAGQRASLEAMRRLSAGPGSDMPIASGPPSVSDNVITDLKRQIVTQETRLSQLRERFLDTSTEVRAAQQTVADLREMLASEVTARLEGLDAQIKAAESKRQVVLDELARVEEQLQALPLQQSRMTELDRRIAVLKESYAELSRRSDQTRIAQATSSNITVLLLTPAGRAVPLNTRDYARLALAPAFSLLVGLGLAFFLDSLDTTVRTAAEAEQALQLPVLATLADRRRRASSPSP